MEEEIIFKIEKKYKRRKRMDKLLQNILKKYMGYEVLYLLDKIIISNVKIFRYIFQEMFIYLINCYEFIEKYGDVFEIWFNKKYFKFLTYEFVSYIIGVYKTMRKKENRELFLAIEKEVFWKYLKKSEVSWIFEI
jgi:hypothetical protein